MSSHNPTIDGIETLRQKNNDYSIEEIVLDFLQIWGHIHQEAKNHTLAEASIRPLACYQQILIKILSQRLSTSFNVTVVL